MAVAKKDPTEPMRLQASRYPGVDKGTACTQTSFKASKKAFLYVGMQGGRHKAMFKLADSIPEAEALATKHPDDFEVGKGGWVSARFTAAKPMPKKLWSKWLDESYGLSVGTAGKATKKTSKKAATRKKIARRG